MILFVYRTSSLGKILNFVFLLGGWDVFVKLGVYNLGFFGDVGQ